MKVLIATIALVLVALAEASYLPYGGGVVSSYATTFPVTSSIAYPSYGLYGKSVFPVAKYAAYPSVYNSYPLVDKVVAYAAPTTVYGGAKVVSYGTGYGFGAGYGFGYGKVLPSKYYY